MDDATVYGSPASETPYSTPLYATNRVPITYRMNPVRLVRQHVPLKIQSYDSPTRSSFVDLEKGGEYLFRNSQNEYSTNVPNTSDNKKDLTVTTRQQVEQCLVTGDRATGYHYDAFTCESCKAFFKRSMIKNAVYQCKYGHCCDIDTYMTRKCHECRLKRCLNIGMRFEYAVQRSQCNPKGDAIAINRPRITFSSVVNAGGDNKSKIPVPFTNLSSGGGGVACISSSGITRKESQLKESSIPYVMESLIPVEEEVQSTDQNLKCNLQKYRDENMRHPDEALTLPTNVNEAQGQVKEVKKRCTLTRKAVSSKTSQNNLRVLHKCDKKKFYDRQDIRNYIRKKKNERKAKEMQEKFKKATEQQVAIKQKADEVKFSSNRVKFSAHKSSEHNQIYKEPSRVKNLNNCKDSGKSLSKEIVQVTKNRMTNISKSENSVRVNVIDQSSSPRTRISSYRERSNIYRTENHSTDQPMSTRGSRASSASNQINEIEVKCHDSRSRTADNSIKTHQKWGNFLIETRAHTDLPLQHELTLSDLNVSPEIGSEDSIICNANTKIDKIFAINEELDTSHKWGFDKYGEEELKENKNTLEVSGICPLSSSRGISPLSESNFITNNIKSECSPSSRFEDYLLQSSHEVRSDERYKDAKHVSRRSSIGKNKTHPVLTKVTSLESLKVPNMTDLLSAHSMKYSLDSRTTQDVFLKSLIMEDINLSLKTELADNNTDKILIDTLSDSANLSSTTLWIELYDQMLNNEDEKLAHIVQKIHQQKECLNKHLKSEILDLELQKRQYRESKEEEKIRVLKKRQRAVLVRVTKNILELEKMQKTITEMVGKRKAELLKRKLASQVTINATPKARKSTEAESKTYLISNQTETVSGISSSCASVILDDIERNLHINDPRDSAIIMGDESKLKIRNLHLRGGGNTNRKDRATSPVHFNTGITIRLDLDPEKIAHVKPDCTQVIIEANPSVFSSKSILSTQSSRFNKPNPHEDKTMTEILAPEFRAADMASSKTSVRIKRPLSPMIFSPSKKISHLRYHSSSSDVILPFVNDTTTTDQSDLELRISALQEQLRKRKLEAERLRKEEEKIRKEKLRTKEQSLMKQLEAYEQYIKRISQMLFEESCKITPGISKPLIKPMSSRKQQSDVTCEKVGASTSSVDGMSVGSHVVCEEDVETDTEDSDKQLKKADSGILVESEVTEVSETVESRCQEVVGVEEANLTLSEISNSMKKSSPEDGTVDGSSKMPNKFLQLVSDLQDEVLSLSEKLYTPDFVEDAADSKSDNTSLSIDVILSDYRSEKGDAVKSTENMANIVQSIVTPANNENLWTVVESLEKENKRLINGKVSSLQINANNESGEIPRSTDDINSDLESITGILNIKDISDIESLDIEVETKMAGMDDSEVGELKYIHDQAEEDRTKETQEETGINDADVIELSSTEFLKVVNRFDERKDSYVADVHYLVPDENEIKTLVEELPFSEPADLTLTHSKLVLQLVVSPVSNNVAFGEMKEDRFVSTQQNLMIDNGPEETDISESLEYDVSIEPSRNDSLEEFISSVEIESPKSGSSEGTSQEQNRSIEELLEDHSVPNIFGATFIVDDIMCDVNVDYSDSNRSVHTPSPPGPSLSMVVREESDKKEILDARITEDQTPFLQALKRDRNNSIAGNFQSKNYDTIDLVDTLVERTYSDLLHILPLKEVGDEPERFQAAERKCNELDAVFQMRTENSNFINEYVEKFGEEKTEGDSRRSSLPEAEQLLQQMKIEEEIGAIQTQQSIPPYIYLQEIPNKPPPPYISPTTQLVCIPTSEGELRQVASSIIEYVCEQLEKGVNPDDVTQISEPMEDKSGCDANVYKQFLLDLTKEVACDIIDQTKEKKGDRIPWEETNKTVSTKRKPRGELLRSLIQTRIGEYFGFRSRINREKLIIQWSRKKKRDFVDDVLIQELQEEEAEWTKYDEDELIIKNRITDNLLDELIKDTVVSLLDAFQTKKQFLQTVI